MSINKELSVCSIKWDIDVNEAKHIFRDLGINFLSKFERNFDLNNNKKDINLISNIIQFNDDLEDIQLKTNEHKRNNKLTESETKTRVISINNLSDELVLNILRYLSAKTLIRCSQVNKRWNRIAFDSTLWKSIHLSKKYLSLSQLQAILKNGVVNCRLSSTTISHNNSLTRISSFNCIQCLDLTMAKISVQSINQLLGSNFADISLKKLSLESLTIDEKTLDLIVSKHKYLQVLNLSMTQFSDCDSDSQLFISFNDKLPETLIELNISWISRLNISKTIAFMPKSLKRLNMSGFRDSMNDMQMRQLVTMCPHLIELDLCDCLLLTEESLHCIESHLTALEALHISRCHRIRDLSSLLNIKDLKVVSIQGIVMNEIIDFNSIGVNTTFISTIARPKSKIINESYSSIWEMPLKII